MVDKKEMKYILVSPSAKGAKIIEKITGRKASTIHRGLHWRPEGFEYYKDNQLSVNLVVVDETSLVDIYVFRSLLQAIPDGCKVLLIGDHFQLESVQAGNILQDIIESGVFPIIKLETVFRQKSFSGILSVATDTRLGIQFFNKDDEILEIGDRKDCKFWAGDKTYTAKRVLMIFKELIKKYDINDVVTISPIKNGCSGVKILNNLMQEVYNTSSNSKQQIELQRCVFRENDPVVNIKNNYQAEHLDNEYEPNGEMSVFNGDAGTIKKIDTENRVIYVDFGDKIIAYTSGEFDCLELGYCLTCHRMQGDSRKYVILAMDWSHFMNLKRSLLYTSVTRASEKLFIIGDKKALSYAIKNNSLVEKKTFLKQLLVDFDNDNIISFK
jgi:exodeoxyribonuclease V alpha subunit